jgi:hypothetical protein
MERKASLFLLDAIARLCNASTQAGGKSQSSPPYCSPTKSHVLLDSSKHTNTFFLFQSSDYSNYMGARPRARSVLSSRKSQTHGPNFSGALIEVSIKSSCAYTHNHKTIHVGL